VGQIKRQRRIAFKLEATAHVGDAGHSTPFVYQVWSRRASRSEDLDDFRSRCSAAWWPWPLMMMMMLTCARKLAI